MKIVAQGTFNDKKRGRVGVGSFPLGRNSSIRGDFYLGGKNPTPTLPLPAAEIVKENQ